VFSVRIQEGPFNRNRSAARLVGHADGGIRVKGHTILSLLNVSKAFDCIDRLVLFQHLQVAVGIGDNALDWIRSFLSGRTQQVVYRDEHSVTSVVLFDVPLRTVLGPLLYILYMAPLFDIITQHWVNVHQYADYLQLVCRQRKPRSLLTFSMSVSSTSTPG